jgi:mono/diheme cytochrome c family protein
MGISRHLLAFAVAALPLIAADTQVLEQFESSVRPVLAQQCFQCHGQGQQMGGLRVDSRDRLLHGGGRGPAIVAGDPGHSLLIKALRQDGALKMPMGGKLSEAQIDAFEKWIQAGAPWPVTEHADKLGPGDPGYYEQLMKEHWAFQPVKHPQPPPGKDDPIDRFILAALEKKGLKLSPASERRALIRRVSFVLTGLPPTPLEIELFVRDEQPGAYERVVDRLMKSSHFGEQFARHWMDVVRFGETLGNDWNYDFPGAWHYRDYLIRAFNSDVPFDQLVREHVAGDLLAKPRTNPETGLNESKIGTAFYRLGEQGHDDCVEFREIRTDVVDNQIDTLGKAFMGLTVSCARCHDHKLDPIPTADYYSLYGMLTSSRMVMRTADLPGRNANATKVLADLKPKIRTELGRVWMREAESFGRYLLAADNVSKKMAPESTDGIQLDRLQQLVVALQRKEELDLSDPLYPWMQLSRAANWNEESSKLSARYAEEMPSRAAYNRENFIPFGDFRSGGLSGWHEDGTAQLTGASPPGEFSIEPVGTRAVTGVYPAGIYTHALSQRLNASLWSPLVPKDKKFVSIQVAGGRLASRRLVIDNCMLSEEYELLESDSLVWKKSPTRSELKLPYYVELVTKSDNPRFPERPGRLKWPRPEEIDAPFSYFGIARAVLHDVDATPKDELTHLRELMSKPSATPEEMAGRYTARLVQAVTRWTASRATDDDARWIQWALENKVLPNSTAMSLRLGEMVDDYRAADARIHEPTVFHAMADLDPGYDVPILLAGNARSFGKIVPRGGELSLLKNYSLHEPRSGSGRLQTADLIASAQNPLTSRVMVNRIWNYLFGRGIVPTTDNFGKYGDMPSNPELLDYLATRFVEEGWSTKKMIRQIVLSKTFQQSSDAVPDAVAIDPENRLLHRYPVRRLEAESIRDAILVTSGRLDGTLYGPSIQPFRTEPKDYRKLFKGPLDGNGRRSIYLKVTRHEGPPFLETFDFPQPMMTRGVRDVTNVPSQALALMNDPFVLNQADYWATQLIAEPGSDMEGRVNSMFLKAFGRDATVAELQRFTGMASELASLRKVEKEKILTDKNVWKDIAHSMFLQKEFIYLR